MSGVVAREATSVKLDKKVKDEAKVIFKSLGLTMGEAFNIFLHQVTLNRGLPFDVRIPNSETRKILEEGQQGINIEDCSLDELEQIKNEAKAS